MKDFYVLDAAQFENKVITTSFVVASKQVRPRKTGELYLQLTLADRTGHLDAKMWDNVADHIDVFEQDDFVKVKGLLNRFNGKFQFTVHKLRRLQDSEIDFTDYLPKTSKDVDALWASLAATVETFENQYLKGLVRAFMADPAIASAYRNAPAAKTLHHAFIGGLVDHVCSLFRLCELAVQNYPQINRDLLLSGAFLHDIGKIHELSYNRSIQYTTEGQLLGHMIIELEMLHRKTAEVPGFPAELKLLLEHMIISHHGQYEFGSPKLPMFPEALMLHYLDDLDSKMESMRAQLAREALNEDAWAGYNSSLGRPLLDSRKIMQRVMSPKAAQQPNPEPGQPDPASTPAEVAATAGSE
ncbi:MAG TPA: OB-fold nucleic acid binding domain-containing protein [Terriglobales bacterium]|nr:OB-fold nucleic acid binding domain-containing protein [Terriglobales bacterium]